jgi:hypothetical protein
MTTGTPSPRAFVSHSHADKQAAEELARALRARGVDAWLDKWEINPGDSLVQKIFEEGLNNCAVFLILLSPESIQSKWVKHELDAALIQKIDGITRVIPVIVRPCTIPVALRTLLWLDLAGDPSRAAQRIADVAYGRTARPPIGAPSGPQKTLQIKSLSDYASALALTIAPALLDEPTPSGFDGETLAKRLNLGPDQVNDAVDELKSLGLVKVHTYLGTHPFNFGIVEPTYALALHLKEPPALSYSPEADIVTVAAAIAALQHSAGEAIAERTGLPASRINHAVAYLADYGHIKLLRSIGTAPYSFSHAQATAATRRFVEEHAR